MTAHHPARPLAYKPTTVRWIWLGAAAWLLAAPVWAIDGPRMAMAPPAGKPPDLFAAEADFCRSEADIQTSTTPAGPTIVSSAVVGTVVGAAVGSVLSSRRHDRTAAGAVGGLILGTANGLNRSAANEAQDQQRYDAVYEQCMLAKGNLSPRFVYRQTAATVAAPPPPPLAPPAPSPSPPARTAPPPASAVPPPPPAAPASR